MLYRLPLNGAPIGAVAVNGVPADQFAFDSRNGRFRGLLSHAEVTCTEGTPLSLLDIPLSAFGATLRHVGARGYAPLPSADSPRIENRFVGDWLIYARSADRSPITLDDRQTLQTTLFAVPLASPRNVSRVALPHNAIRIERVGSDAVVTGYRNIQGLSLSFLSLGTVPRLASTTLLPGRFESEGRSHAFNAWVPRSGSGLVGIPTSKSKGRIERDWSNSESSELSFVSIAPDRTLEPAGELSPRGERQTAPGYACSVSCTDWYGNSRPIFTGGRIFALMGTELVEGRLEGGRIRETGRVDLTAMPSGQPAPRSFR